MAKLTFLNTVQMHFNEETVQNFASYFEWQDTSQNQVLVINNVFFIIKNVFVIKNSISKYKSPPKCYLKIHFKGQRPLPFHKETYYVSFAKKCVESNFVNSVMQKIILPSFKFVRVDIIDLTLQIVKLKILQNFFILVL